MGLDLTPRCAKCGRELELGSMRALGDGKTFVCKNCYEQGNSKSPFSVNKDALREPAPMKPEKDEEDILGRGDSIFDQKEYICNSCGYKFKKNSEFLVKMCPYCGKKDVSQTVEQNADVLLD